VLTNRSLRLRLSLSRRGTACRARWRNQGGTQTHTTKRTRTKKTNDRLTLFVAAASRAPRIRLGFLETGVPRALSVARIRDSTNRRHHL